MIQTPRFISCKPFRVKRLLFTIRNNLLGFISFLFSKLKLKRLALKKHPEEMLQVMQAESYDKKVRFLTLLCSPSLDTDIIRPAAAVPLSTSEK